MRTKVSGNLHKHTLGDLFFSLSVLAEEIGLSERSPEVYIDGAPGRWSAKVKLILDQEDMTLQDLMSAFPEYAFDAHY